MRNRSFLPLMEILLTVCIFSVAAAICLYGFVTANGISQKRSELDTSVLLAQDVCEILKYTRGDMDTAAGLTGGTVNENGMVIYCGEDGKSVNRDSTYFTVTVTRLDGEKGLGRAKVTVCTASRTVYELSVAWQENL